LRLIGRRQRRGGILFDHLVGQRIPLLDQLLLVLHPIDALHRGGQCLKPILRLLPITLFDQLLHLGELLRGQHDLVAAF
jgi:hypothetical protein